MLERREKENKRENILQRNKKTNNQPVILSGERSSESNFCEVNNGAEAQGVAEAGYGLNFRWLANGMLHQFKSHPNFLPYPIVAIAPRFCLFASLNPQNFDYAKRKRFSPLRMTDRVFVWWCALEKAGDS